MSDKTKEIGQTAVEQHKQYREQSLNLMGPISSAEESLLLEEADKESAFTMKRGFTGSFPERVYDTLSDVFTYKPDSEFDITKHYRALEQQHQIPVEQLDSFKHVTSYEEMVDKVDDIRRLTENQQMLHRMGWRGTAASMLGQFVDLDTIALSVVSYGSYLGPKLAKAAVSVAKSKRMHKVGYMAGVGLEAGALSELAQSQLNPTYDIRDLPAVMLGSLAFGTGLGAVLPVDKLATQSMKTLSATRVKPMEDIGRVEDPMVFTKKVEPTEPLAADEGSIGAMRAVPTEKLNVSPITQEYMTSARDYLRKTDVVNRRLKQEDPNRKISEKFVNKMNEASQHIPGMQSGFDRLMNSDSIILNSLGHSLYSDASGAFRNVQSGAHLFDYYTMNNLQDTFIKHDEMYKVYLKESGKARSAAAEQSFWRDVTLEQHGKYFDGDTHIPSTKQSVVDFAETLDGVNSRAIDNAKGLEGETPVWGSENIEHLPGWNRFTWNARTYAKLMDDPAVTDKNILRALKDGYKRANPTWDDEVVGVTARALLSRVRDAEGDVTMNIAEVLRNNGPEHLEQMFINSGVDPVSAKRVVDGLQKQSMVADKGKVSALKRRNEIDPRTPIPGTSHMLMDLMDNSIPTNTMRYVRSMAGASAMARHGIQKSERSAIKHVVNDVIKF